jgi:hypothetical protein
MPPRDHNSEQQRVALRALPKVWPHEASPSRTRPDCGFAPFYGGSLQRLLGVSTPATTRRSRSEATAREDATHISTTEVKREVGRGGRWRGGGGVGPHRSWPRRSCGALTTHAVYGGIDTVASGVPARTYASVLRCHHIFFFGLLCFIFCYG